MSTVDKTSPRPQLFSHYFTVPGQDLEGVKRTVTWHRVTAEIREGDRVVFRQENVEAPVAWSQAAVNIVAQKYFRGHVGEAGREDSIWGLITRVVKAIGAWGRADGYLVPSEPEAYDLHEQSIFEAELAYLLLHQHLAFNSPVWFNVGVEERPQASACFISSVGDSLAEIMEFASAESRIFQSGSGSGANLSAIRAEGEHLSRGGTASGPVSFMRGFDAFAGVIKSGGKTRRAAKMVLLDDDHLDLIKFIDCKLIEEKKAHALIDAGFNGAFNEAGGAYESVGFQNANHSIRLSDEFMRAVQTDGTWTLRGRVAGTPEKVVKAKEVFRRAAEAAHACGDPGVQFSTTINEWHTSANSGRINASNPCSEFVYLDNTACNLASLNLMKFVGGDGHLVYSNFEAAVRISILAQEILVDRASYPTEAIGTHTRMHRPLGLGYSNLGAYLMTKGLPYDSDGAREVAAEITSFMTATAYVQSAHIAGRLGEPSIGWGDNAAHFHAVLEKHLKHAQQRGYAPAISAWKEAISLHTKYGFRNGQVTVMAPTGTISFMMDCATTGIEPELALVKYKKLVGGGTMRIVNPLVQDALRGLGYDQERGERICKYIEEYGTIEGAPDLHVTDLPVFDCSLAPANGSRSISPMGHVKMMAAVQPFLSGAISKTVNMPSSSTVEDVEEIYMEAWKRGLKAIAIYRDGCKRSQPLSTAQKIAAPGTALEQLYEAVFAFGDADAYQIAGEETFEVEPIRVIGRATVAEIAPQTRPIIKLTLMPQELARTEPLAGPPESFEDEGPTAEHEVLAESLEVSYAGSTPSMRRRLPDERPSVTHKFDVAGHEGYITVGFFEDGAPGEIFITMAKEGSTISGLMDAFATALSIGLQHGVPLETFVRKFKNAKFEPSGFTINKDIRQASSVVDYVASWLEDLMKRRASVQVVREAELAELVKYADDLTKPFEPPVRLAYESGPLCSSCGSLTQRAGSCYACSTCGATSGCG